MEMVSAGYPMPATRCRLPDAGHPMPATRCRLPDAGYPMVCQPSSVLGFSRPGLGIFAAGPWGYFLIVSRIKYRPTTIMTVFPNQTIGAGRVPDFA